MMHTYIQLPDGTHIGYGEPLADGTVKAAAVRFGEGGFSVALCVLPDCRWVEAEGYAPEELEVLAGLLAGNAPLIMRLSQEAAAQAHAAAEEVADVEPSSQAAEPSRPTQGQPPMAAMSDSQTVPGPELPDRQNAGEPRSVADAQKASAAPRTQAGPSPTAGQGARAAQAAQSQDYQQAAAAMLDAASLVGRVVPGTRVGRLVNTAMPAARTVVAAAPGIVEKAAPVVSHAAEAAAEAAPKMAEKAARGIGRLGSKIAKAASGAVDSVVDGAKQAAENYHRESGR